MALPRNPILNRPMAGKGGNEPMDKRIIKKCDDIFHSFDMSSEEHGFDYEKNSLRMLIESIVEENKRRDSIFEISDPDIDKGFDLDQDLIMVSFGLGYLVGQLYDITNPKTLKSVGSLKKSLRQKNNFPFFPYCARERKGGSHEKRGEI